MRKPAWRLPLVAILLLALVFPGHTLTFAVETDEADEEDWSAIRRLEPEKGDYIDIEEYLDQIPQEAHFGEKIYNVYRTDYDLTMSTETARRSALYSRQAERARLGLDAADAGMRMAQNQVETMEELFENIRDMGEMEVDNPIDESDVEALEDELDALEANIDGAIGAIEDSDYDLDDNGDGNNENEVVADLVYAVDELEEARRLKVEEADPHVEELEELSQLEEVTEAELEAMEAELEALGGEFDDPEEIDPFDPPEDFGEPGGLLGEIDEHLKSAESAVSGALDEDEDLKNDLLGDNNENDGYITRARDNVDDAYDEVEAMQADVVGTRQAMEEMEGMEDIMSEEELDELEDMMVTQAEMEAMEAEHQAEEARKEWETIGQLELQFAAESLLVTLKALEMDLQSLAASYTTVDRLVEAETMRKEVGMSTEHEVEDLELQRDEVRNGVLAMASAYESLQREFLTLTNQYMHQDVYAERVEADLEAFEETFDFDEALDYALNEGAEVGLAEMELEHAEERKDFMEEEFDDDGDEFELAEIEVEQAELNLEETEDNVEKALYTSYDNFKDAMNEYRRAEGQYNAQRRDMEMAELMKEVGMISTSDYENILPEYLESFNLYRQARLEAYLAMRELEHLDEHGVIVEGVDQMDDGMPAAPAGAEGAPGEPGDPDDVGAMMEDNMDQDMDMPGGAEQPGAPGDGINGAPGGINGAPGNGMNGAPGGGMNGAPGGMDTGSGGMDGFGP